jgi:hypothetical protein
MKPGDHPDFFQRPAPEGRSRESTIRLDHEGRFSHEGRLVEHAGLSAALHTWIGRHPDDGRYILSNGHDWTYFTVEDAPFIVRSIRVEPERIVLVLSDGTEQDWDPGATRIAPSGALYTVVRLGAHGAHDAGGADGAGGARGGGTYEAKFSRHAQTSLAPVLADEASPAVVIGGRVHAIGAKKTRFG